MNFAPGILPRIPLFKLYRKFGWPQLLPLNLTLSPSPKLQLALPDLQHLDEAGGRTNDRRVGQSSGFRSERHRTGSRFSGGEPLMYPHVSSWQNWPIDTALLAFINIPTNSLLPTIPDRVERIAKACPESQLIINLSLDGIGAKHDYIRGIPGNFVKFEERVCVSYCR